jgi:protein O-mannosyl-transferase
MPSGSIRTAALAALAAGLALVAYANSLHGPFVFDDSHEIVENRSIESLRDPLVILRGNSARPLLNLSYAIDYARSGKDVFGYHVTNVVLHTANVLLLFLLVRQLVKDVGHYSNRPETDGADLPAFLAASLFAVHPMMTEAVSYVSSRSELLVGLFFLGGLYAFRQAFEGRRVWLVGGCSCLLLGLASKETAAMLPFVLFASDLLVPSKSGWRSRFWRIHVPLLSVVVVAGGVRAWRYLTLEQAQGVGALATWEHAALQLHVIVRYLSLLLLPRSQTIVPAVSPIVSLRDTRLVIAIVILIGIGALVFRARKTAPLVAFGMVWFALVLLPSSVLSLPEKIAQPMAEHRVYLASCGFFLAVAVLAVRLMRWQVGAARSRNAWVAVGTAAVLMVFLALTIARNRVWGDAIHLWEDAALKAPDIYVAQANLGYEQWLAGNCDAAEAAYRRAMDLRPTQSDPYVISADCLMQRGRINDAASMLQLGTIRAPTAFKVRLSLATLEERQFRRPAEALRLCREALAIEPGSEAAQDCIRRNQSK